MQQVQKLIALRRHRELPTVEPRLQLDHEVVLEDLELSRYLPKVSSFDLPLRIAHVPSESDLLVAHQLGGRHEHLLASELFTEDSFFSVQNEGGLDSLLGLHLVAFDLLLFEDFLLVEHELACYDGPEQPDHKALRISHKRCSAVFDLQRHLLAVSNVSLGIQRDLLDLRDRDLKVGIEIAVDRLFLGSFDDSRIAH